MAAQDITGNGSPRGACMTLSVRRMQLDAERPAANVRVAGRLDAGCLGTYHSCTGRNLDIPTLVAGALPLPLRLRLPLPLPIPEAR